MRLASASAIVLLPEPDTPIKTSAQGIVSATKVLRKRRTVGEPDGLADRACAIGRKVLVCEQPRQDRALCWACDLEQHFAAGRQCRQSKCDSRHERLDIGLGHAHD